MDLGGDYKAIEATERYKQYIYSKTCGCTIQEAREASAEDVNMVYLIQALEGGVREEQASKEVKHLRKHTNG